jgi:hypothetical protein
MTKTITPQDALVHFQALWPWASNLHKGRSVGEVVLRGENPGDVTRLYSQAIDWPEGVDRWPPPEPAEQWREAVMPQDWGKPCRVRDNDDQIWIPCSEIQGRSKHSWAVNGTWWKQCQVRVEPKEKPTHCPACKLETKGCTWCSDPKPGCCMPNEPPKQVRVEPNPTGKDCLQVEDEWLPMDSAPKDDVKVFLLMGGEQVIGGWTDIGKMWISLSKYSKSLDWDKANHPTGWRPLS